MTTLTGKFEVSMQPQKDESFDVRRMTLDKTYFGDLKGHAKGQMLSHVTQVNGSAGYVAIEIFDGEVNGKKGSFVLQHSGQMDKRAQSLDISIIPDSGSGELVGISGNMSIEIKEGQHFYHFEYALP
ncbi:DUF3224 domain-containing protein [Aliiglaciecola sp. M165]|uniref:DUF3224 domain-containing protein n=1 Tax=Aliiglaciecola sp. M165 TaxID=2593649 RepID=UPI0011808439|nr:DUF3224 domain-containing protein [Aliiglaciecola sp. M165]TRY33183.1 DUF3224 domain-containing protein [Aliiglaciecola sp. M165]